MGLFNKLKAGLGIGQPKLSIELDTDQVYERGSIDGTLVLENQERPTSVSKLLVWLDHVRDNTDPEAKLPKTTTHHKLEIPLDGVELGAQERFEHRFSVPLDGSLERVESSRFFLRAQADIPGLDAKAQIKVFLTDVKPPPPWRQRCEALGQALQAHDEIVVRRFDVRPPASPDALAALEARGLHPNVLAFFAQMDGVFVNAHHEPSGNAFYLFVPQAAQLAALSDDYMGGSFWPEPGTTLFCEDAERMSAAYLQPGSDLVDVVADGKRLPLQLPFESFLDALLDLKLFRSIFACIEMDFSGKEFTDAHSRFKDLVRTGLIGSDRSARRLFTQHLSTKRLYEVIEPIGSDTVAIRVKLSQPLRSLTLIYERPTEEREVLPDGSERITMKSVSFDVDVDPSLKAGDSIDIPPGRYPSGPYSALIVYADGTSRRISTDI